MLAIRGISKTYSNGVVALNNVSLDVGAGMFGLLGPNGAGKSSLMRTIATLQDPDSGTISFDGIDVVFRHADADPRLRRRPADGRAGSVARDSRVDQHRDDSRQLHAVDRSATHRRILAGAAPVVARGGRDTQPDLHDGLPFFCYLSARWQVKRDEWHGIPIEIYYDAKHPYNVDRMIADRPEFGRQPQGSER